MFILLIYGDDTVHVRKRTTTALAIERFVTPLKRVTYTENFATQIHYFTKKKTAHYYYMQMRSASEEQIIFYKINVLSVDKSEHD